MAGRALLAGYHRYVSPLSAPIPMGTWPWICTATLMPCPRLIEGHHTQLSSYPTMIRPCSINLLNLTIKLPAFESYLRRKNYPPEMNTHSLMFLNSFSWRSHHAYVKHNSLKYVLTHSAGLRGLWGLGSPNVSILRKNDTLKSRSLILWSKSYFCYLIRKFAFLWGKL